MADNLTPAKFCSLIQPYADAHKNPKVRGKAGVAMAASVARMQVQCLHFRRASIPARPASDVQICDLLLETAVHAPVR